MKPPKRGKRTCEFELDESQESLEEITLEVHRVDPLSSEHNEVIAAKTIPLEYFRGQRKIGFEDEFWLQLNNLVDPIQREGRVFLAPHASLLTQYRCPTFEESVIRSEEEDSFADESM